MTQPAPGPERRRRGAFWTPLDKARDAHRLLDHTLGEDWPQRYVVWDPACGGLHLTKERTFRRLYASTLHVDELDPAANPEATRFQFDFLNDPLTNAPASLQEALARREPIIFLANPPYAQATDYGGARKSGVATNAVGKQMRGMGHAATELYTQFYFRAMSIAQEFGYERDVHILFFSKSGFLTSPAYSTFTDTLTRSYGFQGGFVFNAREFDGAAGTWGVCVCHWALGAEPRELAFPVAGAGVWRPRQVAKQDTLSAWLAEIALQPTRDEGAPLTTNGLDPAGPRAPLKLRDGWIGYLHNNGDTVQYANKYTGFYSLGFGSAHGRDVTRENIWRAAIVFALRRALHRDIAEQGLLWVRDKDVFRRPSPQLVDASFATDCLVFSLADPQSRQTSLRNWHGHARIVNEFFPFGRDWVKSVATAEVRADLSGDDERFVHLLLRDQVLSPEAAAVLECGREIITETMPKRRDFHTRHPRFQVLSWDAGWLQLSQLASPESRQRLATAVSALARTIAERAYADGVLAR